MVHLEHDEMTSLKIKGNQNFLSRIIYSITSVLYSSLWQLQIRHLKKNLFSNPKVIWKKKIYVYIYLYFFSCQLFLLDILSSEFVFCKNVKFNFFGFLYFMFGSECKMPLYGLRI